MSGSRFTGHGVRTLTVFNYEAGLVKITVTNLKTCAMI
jgi:hypothetical protein